MYLVYFGTKIKPQEKVGEKSTHAIAVWSVFNICVGYIVDVNKTIAIKKYPNIT